MYTKKNDAIKLCWYRNTTENEATLLLNRYLKEEESSFYHFIGKAFI